MHKPLYTGNSEMGTLANSGDQDEMKHITLHFIMTGLHCLLKLKHPSGTEMHHN